MNNAYDKAMGNKHQSKDSIEEDKQIVLSLDANIILSLSKAGWIELIPAIASLPGVTIEIPDFIGNIEIANRLRKLDNSYEYLSDKNIKQSINRLFSTAEYLDFIPELKEIADDPSPDADRNKIKKALQEGRAYEEYPSSNIVIVSTLYGSDINSQALEYKRCYAEIKEAIGGDRKEWTQEKIDSYNQGKSSESALISLDDLDVLNVIETIRSEYKSQGELALMEREKYANQEKNTRVVISDDRGRADMIKTLDAGNTVNIANLPALIKALDANFKDEINQQLPKGHEKFSANKILPLINCKVPVDLSFEREEGNYKKTDEQGKIKVIPNKKVIDKYPLDKALEELKLAVKDLSQEEHVAAEKPTLRIKTETLAVQDTQKPINLAFQRPNKTANKTELVAR